MIRRTLKSSISISRCAACSSSTSSWLFFRALPGESLLKNKPLRWLLLFVPLFAGVCFAQFQLFPGTQHVEWPGAAPKNSWEQAFVWIRGNTHVDAIFALDPN